MSSAGEGDKFNCCDSCSDFDQCRADRTCFFGRVTEAVTEELFADAVKHVPEFKLIEAETSRDELAAIAQSALAYLQGCEPTTVAGGVRNLALRERIKQALARAGRGG